MSIEALRQKETEALYRTMSHEWLEAMQRALWADRKEIPAWDRDNLAFCDARIAIIDRILEERRTT